MDSIADDQPAQAADDPPVVRLDNVHKRFGDVDVLRGVSLEVSQGETLAIIGPSGGGKSTLLRCVNALEVVSDGHIFLEGEDFAHRGADLNRLRQRVGMVFQHFNLFPHMTVSRNLTLAPTKLLRLGQAEAKERAQELLKRVGLSDKAKSHPGELSGGQQQRVAIARALMMQPHVMLFDEATSALDPELIGEVLDTIEDLAKSGMTMLIVTHEIGFAREVADRVAFLADGVVAELGPPTQVLDDPKEERTQQFLRKVLR